MISSIKNVHDLRLALDSVVFLAWMTCISEDIDEKSDYKNRLEEQHQVIIEAYAVLFREARQNR